MTATESNACCKLAGLADELARQPGITPKDFIYKLGEKAAGIRPGLWRYFDLFKGGANPLPGKGFKAEYDDGSGGQARHFAGIAVSCLTLGPKLTVWVSENLRLDQPNTPDGRLTLAAADFTQKLVKGELPPTQAGQWIRDNLSDGC